METIEKLDVTIIEPKLKHPTIFEYPQNAIQWSVHPEYKEYCY